MPLLMGIGVFPTESKHSAGKVVEAVEEAVAALGAEGHTHDAAVSKVSVVGLGMSRLTGVASPDLR